MHEAVLPVEWEKKTNALVVVMHEAVKKREKL
uniref:Uncharacterized protein n=1 Tax=Nelumbo nucifera TaxID=4432 RepID=A0A822XLA7_NELNU|nr:TPA_asm: hypothetical protein HUJ06_021414 [Nelumbo nucifera]